MLSWLKGKNPEGLDKSDSYYITTPIYYANGKPHIGNTYSTTLADSLARYHRYKGQAAFFLTGTDEHGDKISEAASVAGKTPLEFTDEVAKLFKDTWKNLGLEYSRFIRTTEELHKKTVQDILAKVHQKGDIYFGEYGGLYCFGCERFLTEKELVDGKCADHQKEPKYIEEKNYFFKMSNYQERLIDHITNVQPDFIRPERYKNEVLAMLREPLEDLCISRPKSRLTWGIELPFDKDYVTYVWFDALINYLSGLDFPDGENFKKFWPSAEHLIAKDIVKPHGIFWPTMLMSAEIPLYKHLNVHGYWTTPTGKMSKSLGNVVDPITIKNEFGMDVYRYFVFREMVFGLDGSFNPESLETRYNADLANNLGNLVSRSLAMVHRYREGKVPSPVNETPADTELKTQAISIADSLSALIEKMEIHKAMELIWTLIDSANVYIDRTKPWAIAKEEKSDPAKAAELDSVLYFQVETIRIIGSLLTAFLPETSEKILTYLGYQGSDLANQQKESSAKEWGQLKPGTLIQKGEALFPRTTSKIETEKQKMEAVNQTEAKPTPTDDGLISYDEFCKVKLCVGQIMEAEKVEKSEKLIKLQVDMGPVSGTRQIVAGIAKHYQAEELVGRKVLAVSNLKPAKLMGIESQGMLLAASDDLGNLELVSPGLAMPAGAVVK